MLSHTYTLNAFYSSEKRPTRFSRNLFCFGKLNFSMNGYIFLQNKRIFCCNTKKANVLQGLILKVKIARVKNAICFLECCKNPAKKIVCRHLSAIEKALR
jgi:hypothetical protein